MIFGEVRGQICPAEHVSVSVIFSCVHATCVNVQSLLSALQVKAVLAVSSVHTIDDISHDPEQETSSQYEPAGQSVQPAREVAA